MSRLSSRVHSLWNRLKALSVWQRLLAALALLLLTPTVWAFDQWYQPVHHFTIPPDFPGIDARASQPARPHCQAHWDAGARKSGLYRIDTGLLMREQTLWCEMTATEGLTLVMRGYQPSDLDWHTRDAVVPHLPPSVEMAGNYKLEDGDINRLLGDGRFRILKQPSDRWAEVRGCSYNHTGRSNCQPVRCQHNGPVSLGRFLNHMGSGGGITIRTHCRADRQGFEVDSRVGDRHATNTVGDGVYPFVATNDTIHRIGTLARYRYDFLRWWAGKRCAWKHRSISSPQPPQAVGKSAYRKCFDDLRPVALERHAYLSRGERIAMFVLHPSLQPAQSSQGAQPSSESTDP